MDEEKEKSVEKRTGWKHDRERWRDWGIKTDEEVERGQ